jgi:KaiC/GvpD/RAD55 family RecA-like ATPase
MEIIMTDRVKTHIRGFDEILDDGLPQGHVILVIGPAGAMKSSLSYYILYRNALEDGITSAYFCLEEARESFLKNMTTLGLDISEVEGRVQVYGADDRVFLEEKGGQMQTVGWSEGDKDEPVFIKSLKFSIKRLRDGYGIKLLVIDSLDALMLLSKPEDPRDEVFKLFEWLRELGITTLVIGEMPATHPALVDVDGYSEDFLADGIIQLKIEKVNDISYRRYARCVKMRVTKHSPDFFILVYDSDKGEFEVTKALY